MENKNTIVEHVKQWVKIDNEMRQLRDEVLNRRKMKETISNSLLD